MLEVHIPRRFTCNGDSWWPSVNCGEILSPVPSLWTASSCNKSSCNWRCCCCCCCATSICCSFCNICITTNSNQQESWAIAKMTATARCAQYVGALKIFGSPWLRQRVLFPQMFNGLWVLGGGCEPPIFGKCRPYGVGDGTVWKSVGKFLSVFHSNFSSIFTRFRDIAAFVLQNATFSHPTSHIPQISPCSPGSRWMAFWLRRANGLIVRAISFQDYQPMWSHSTNVTRDRQTDDMQSQYRAFTKVHRVVNSTDSPNSCEIFLHCV